MEEATGAPSSFAVYDPRRPRASGRDGGGLMSRPPSPLTMLLSRHTRRREFIAGLGTAVAWPLAAQGQPAERVRRIGVLMWLDENEAKSSLSAFTQALAGMGWTEGRNVRIDLRWYGDNT